MENTDLIFGQGGGGKGGGGGGASNTPNTLRSTARGRIVIAISEGPISGLVAGAKSIYREQTPIQAQDNSFNFQNVIWEEHKGQPDDTHFNGHDDVGSIVQVDALADNATGAAVRTVVEPDADAVRVIVRINSLFRSDTKTGSLLANSVSYAIDVRPAGGVYVEVVRRDLVNEKCMSPVQLSHRVTLPLGGGPWDIRLRRISPDETVDEKQSDVYFESYVILVEGKFIYPHTAAVALEFNAEDIGGNIGAIGFHVKGREIEVPTNYNPVTRVYSGIWDGTFKIAYTNNAPWIFMDMIKHNRYGLGEFIDVNSVNKWSLYTIAQYCDQLVPTGYKDAQGTPTMEPRYTFNGVINGREQAFNVLSSMTATWRGMGFWSLGQVFATADMPSDPKSLVSAANVIDGEFSYSGTAAKSRHSVVIVKWNDPSDFYRAASETIIDNEQIRRFGWREKTVQLNGCTSRGLANRYGRWILDIERYETETVQYRAALDHIDVVPGDIVSIADARRQGIRLAGRLVSQTATTLTLDAPFVMVVGATHTINWVKPNGLIASSVIQSVSGNIVTISDSILAPDRAQPDAMFAISGTDISLPQYRVISVNESDEDIYQVTALLHDPRKYGRVENGVKFDPIRYAPDNTALPRPTNLVVVESSTILSGAMTTRLTVSWTPPTSAVVRSFLVSCSSPNRGLVNLPISSTNAAEIDALEPGQYTFYVKTVDVLGRISEAAELVYTVIGDVGFGNIVISGLELVSGGTVFTGRDVLLRWRNNFPVVTAPGAIEAVAIENSPLYSHSIVEVYRVDTNELMRIDRVTTSSYSYSFEANQSDSAVLTRPPARAVRFAVRTFDVNNAFSVDAQITVSNPQPALVSPLISSNGVSISVQWSNPNDIDIAGALVWIEKNNTFDPLLTAPIFDGAGGLAVFEGDPSDTYYVRVGLYDSFGRTGLNITSPAIIATGLPFISDTVPPGAVTGLLLTSAAQNGLTKLSAAWTGPTDLDLVGYHVEIKEGAGNYVGNATTQPRYEWLVQPGSSFTVRVRAYDRAGNVSAWSGEITHTAVADAIAPAVPSGIVAQGAFETVWLNWAPNTEPDFAGYEIFEASSATPVPTAGTQPSFYATASTLARSGLPATAQIRYYWIRSFDLGGNKSAWSGVVQATTLAGGEVTNASLTGLVDATSLVQTEVISASAQVRNAIITSAKIVSLDAAKIVAGTVLAGSITVDGASLSTINAQSANPAQVVNFGTTQINPGKVLISGTTSLSDWQKGGDVTRIDGGAISANTIDANKLTIGSRGISSSILFKPNNPSPDFISWSAGTIAYIDDAGAAQSIAIAAGSAAWTSGNLFLYWVKGAVVLATTTTAATANQPNNVILARYDGGVTLNAVYGRTVIEGDQIQTGAITADKLNVISVSAVSAVLGEFKSALTGERVEIKSDRVQVFDANNVLRVRLGDLI